MRVAACFFVAGLLLGVSGVGSGHPTGDFFSTRWPLAGTTVVDAYFTTDSGWGAQKKDSVRYGFNRWDFADGADFKFSFPSETHANYPAWERIGCTNPFPNNDIHWDGSIPASANAIAAANACDTNGDGKLDTFIVAFDSDVNYYDGSGTPGSDQADLRATAAHEAGHVTGWGIGSAPDHFGDSSGYCPEDSTKHTMCRTITLGKTWQRTLETHDSHTVANAYPSG